MITAVFKEKGKEPTRLAEALAKRAELLLSANWTCPKDNFSFPEIEPRLFSFNSPYGACPTCNYFGKTDLFLDTICPDCRGKRLKPEALSVKIKGKNIQELTAMSILNAYEFFIEYEGNMRERQKNCQQCRQRNFGQAHFFVGSGFGLLDDGQGSGNSFRRRSPENKAGFANRLKAFRNALCLGRAYHWLARKRHRPADKNLKVFEGARQYRYRGGA